MKTEVKFKSLKKIIWYVFLVFLYGVAFYAEYSDPALKYQKIYRP